MKYRRVVKLGGSLLDEPNLRTTMQRWLSSEPAAVNLFVVGGGEIVEACRTLDAIHEFDASEIHWLCVDLMHVTAQLAQRILGGVPLIETPGGLQALDGSDPGSELRIVSPHAFYCRELNSSDLPTNWDTTSDSIAAFLARVVRADELVLLKSAEHPAIAARNQWSQLGFVDAAFDKASQTLRQVRFVNFRELT